MAAGALGPSVRPAVLVAALAAAYALLGAVGDAFTVAGTPVSRLWPSAGLALAALLVLGLRLWPGVLAGGLLWGVADGTLSTVDLCFAVAGTVEAVVAVLVVRRLLRGSGPPDLTRSRHVVALLGGALAGAATGAVIVLPGLFTVDALVDVPHEALVWGLGGLLGSVLVAPLLLAVPGWLPRRPPPWRVAEAAVLMAGTVAVATSSALQGTPVFLLVPLLVLAAVRFGPVGAAAATVAAGAPLLGVVAENDSGPFLQLAEPTRFLYTAVFLLLFGTGSLLLQSGYRERSLATRRLAANADALTVANRDLAEANRDLAGRGSELERAYGDLTRSEERFRLTFEHAPMGVLLTTLDGRCLRANAAFGELVGRAAARVVGMAAEQMCHPEDRATAAATRDEMLGSPHEHKSWEIRFLRPDGTAIWGKVNGAVEHDTAGVPRYLVYLVEDVSERKQAELRLAHMAFHDPLTELPNRALLRDRLEVALRKLSRRPGMLAVLFSDLDRFKVINDTLGHDMGDRLLVAVASRMRAALRPGDTVARFGGDEFVVLAEGLPDEDAVAELTGRLHASLRAPFVVQGRELTVGASIGVALGRSEHQRPDELIGDADAAMYLAKAEGPSRTVLFGNDMRTRLTRRLDLEDGLRHALETGGLQLHYQPQVSLTDGHVVGVEALLRWNDERWRRLPVPEVIAVAEETGLILPMGAWVIGEACRQLVRWDAQRPERRIDVVAVNLSPHQLAQHDLVDVVRRVLAETGVEPHRLCVEITETAVLIDADAAVTALEGLRRLGVRIALDDFGTGYSSLSYLKRLPIDVLKIDRSFVATLETDASDAAIVDAVVVMARRLGITTVGEGVETEDQLRALAATGSDHAQGFHLARPVEPQSVIDLVTRMEHRSEVVMGGPPGDWHTHA